MPEDAWQAGDGYRIERFPAPGSAVDEAAVLAFWRAEDAVGADEARRRIDEVLFVGVTPSGALASVVSAYLAVHPQLHLPMWHMRVFVGVAHRRSQLALRLARTVRDDLKARFASGEDQRAAGLLYEVESPLLKTVDTLIWEPVDFAFVGLNARGDHVRVHYFQGACVPLPAGA